MGAAERKQQARARHGSAGGLGYRRPPNPGPTSQGSEKVPTFHGFPISRYDWLNIATDIFLMRIISVLDCCLLVTNEVFECGLKVRQCKLESLQRAGVSAPAIQVMREMNDSMYKLREERNSRIHSGFLRAMTKDDRVFQALSVLERLGKPAIVQENNNNWSDVKDWFRAALKELKRETRAGTRDVVTHYNRLLDCLFEEFSARASAKAAIRTLPLPWQMSSSEWTGECASVQRD